MKKPVVVIGAGPAGLSCASHLVAAGQEVVLIEDNLTAGGQYFRQLPPSFTAGPDAKLLRETRRYQTLSQVLTSPLLQFLPSTVAWGASGPLTIAYAGPERSGRVEASAVVIATGAQDKPFPFTGWTLPGVISAGGCLNLAKAHGLVPQGRVVVAGNGPLVLVAAATLATAQAQLTHVVEARSSLSLTAAAFAGVMQAPRLLLKAIGYRARVMGAGASFMTSWMVAEARGNGRLQEVGIAPIGGDGRPDMSKVRWLECQTLVLGYGLLPATEFARLMGCRLQSVPELGGWVPERSAQLETSVPGVFAIGDGAGIGGVELALLEGQLVAWTLLGKDAHAVSRRYCRMDGFRRTLNKAYACKAELMAATDESIVCRCEMLRLGDLRKQLTGPAATMNTLKTATRLGMGRCQGRNCLSSAAALCGLAGADSDVGPYPRVRPPVRPVPLQYLAADTDAGPALEPDEANLNVSLHNGETA